MHGERLDPIASTIASIALGKGGGEQGDRGGAAVSVERSVRGERVRALRGPERGAGVYRGKGRGKRKTEITADSCLTRYRP